MKVRSLFYGMLCMLALGALMASCSDDNDDDPHNDAGSTVTLPQVRAYFLNEGTMGYNNSTIAFYAPNGDADFIGDIFKVQNGQGLGDTGQDMIEYDDCIYVSVYASNYLAKLNAAGVELARTSFVGDADLSAGIRSLVAEDGYIYASFYGGVVAKINANTLQVEQKLKGLGGNLEAVAISNDMLYVANSYTYNGSQYIYHTEVPVIDLKTFTLKETLTVAQNPNMMVEDDDYICLISWDYSAESYVLQLIEPNAGNRVTRLGYATHVAMEDGTVYVIDSRVNYDNWPETSADNSFYTYNIKTGNMNQTSFLKDMPAKLKNEVIYMIEVNDENGDIYIGTTGHSNVNGEIYRFRKDGSFVESFDCGGQNPRCAVFFN